MRGIACIGLSANSIRPSYFVARYLALKNMRIIPVNPAYAGQSFLGEPFRNTLSVIAEEGIKIDMIDIFRRSEFVGEIVDEALKSRDALGLKTIWMQIGVMDDAAAARARDAGLQVVMNRCPKIEYQRLFGELRMAGFNTGIISSRRAEY